MIARKNPPSFILIEKDSGLVVYTKRATGVGSEAIAACAAKGRALAAKTGKTYVVFLDIRGLKVGMTVNVGMVYTLGITEEIYPPRNPGRVRRNIFAFNNPPSGPADEHAARELELYIDNDSQLYHSQFIPIVKNLMLKRRKGIYNRELAVKLFMYLMDSGAKKYVSEFGTRGQKIDAMFNKNTRMLAARAFRDSFETEAELGNYDRLIGPVSNPLNRKETAQIVNMSRDVARSAIRAKQLGDTNRARAHLAYGRGMLDVGMTFSPHGARKGVGHMLNRYNTIERRESSRSNPSNYYSKGVRDAVNDAVKRHFEFFGERISGGAIAKMLKRTDNLIVAHELSPFNAAHQALIEHLRGRRGGVRENVFVFNNPRKLNSLEQAAAAVGLYVTTWAPGDGVTRYRFHTKPADYHDGSGIFTALGRGDALKFIKSYGMGRGRKNPLTRAEAGQELKFAREAMTRMADAQRSGVSGAADFGYAQGIAGVVGRRGSRASARAAERVMRHGRYNNPPVRQNPYSIVKKFGKGAKGKAAAEKYLSQNYETLSKTYYDLGVSSLSGEWMITAHLVRRNPLLQTVLLANPPISEQWDRMTRRQREAVLEVVGYDRDYQGGMTSSSWATLSPSAKRKLEAQWLDTTSSGGTTRRRRRAVAVNPLTRREAGRALIMAQGSRVSADQQRSQKLAAHYKGRAYGYADAVAEFGPRDMRQDATIKRSEASVFRNPGVKFPKPGTKLTVEQAFDLARRIGDKELMRQCKEAAKLQTKANRGAKCVIWKTLPIGSPNRIDMVTAFAHYGDSPETMYKPPKGSKKGPHMYRHKWGEGTGKTKSVPILAAPGGKALITLMGPGQKTGDWMRG